MIDLHRDGDAVTGARVRNELTGEELDIEAGFTLNASGAWAAQIVHMAGIEGVGVIPGKGIMIAMNHRLVNTVVNRCTMPADGDILVPIRTVSVIGTTDIRAADPGRDPGHAGRGRRRCSTTASGSCPASARRARCASGPACGRCSRTRRRPAAEDTRDVSRTHAVVDHRERDGVDRLPDDVGRQADDATG